MNDITLSEDQDVAYQTMAKWLANGGKVHPKQTSPNLLSLGGYAGSGKAINIEEQIPTPTGYKKIKDIQVGDKVFDDLGNIASVINTTEIFENRKCYEVTFSDNSKVIVDANHLWLTETINDKSKTLRRSSDFKDKRRLSRKSRGTGKKPWLGLLNSAKAQKQQHLNLKPPIPTIKTTQEIYDTLLSSRKRYNHYIRNCRSINLPNAIYEIDPYLLGVWLGDGTSSTGNITTIDCEIFSYMPYDKELLASKQRSSKYAYRIYGLTTKLRSINVLRNKHIPIEYLRGNIEQRKDLLCGLMDTDGTISKDGKVSFCNTNKNIIDGIIELIRSLGITCSVTTKRPTFKYKGIKKFGKLAYNVRFSPDFPVFKLKRKLDKQSLYKRFDGRFIISVREVNSVPVKCITVDSPSSLFLLSNYIPTHNSTLVSVLAKEFGSAIRFAFCALSGRAASILGNKLRAQGVQFGEGSHYCGTIHRLIYKPIEDDKGEVVFWARNPAIDYDVIVLDEASMISEDIFKDLSSYGIDILAVGDHGQLPPIEGRFSLMQDPILRLDKIHRQAQDNPIINLSMQIRETGKIPRSLPDNGHISIVPKSQSLDFLKQVYKGKHNPEDLLDCAVLSYKNATRTRLNMIIRNIVFGSLSSVPFSDDLVICLRNVKNSNSKQPPMYNGYRGHFVSGVTEYDDHFWSAKINFPYEGIQTNVNNICKHQFGYQKTFSSFDELEKFGMLVTHWSEVGLLFDYGYALTVHKMQGSQANHIILFNERPAPVNEDTYRRWLYTAVSRSTDKLTIIP